MECKLEYKKVFYPESVMKSLSYGCYNEACFERATVNGVFGRYVNEGVCPIHGVVFSMLGGIWHSDRPAHPCGAYKESL